MLATTLSRRHGAAVRGLALCAVLALFAVLAGRPAHAYLDNFLSGTLVGTLNQEQVSALVDTFRKTLSDTPDGSSVPLQLPPGGRGNVTDGTLTPLKTSTVRGQRCRQIRTELRQSGKNERWTGWYCQQENGEWRRSTVKE